MYQLHNFSGKPALQGAFGILIKNLFFADNGFGEYVSFPDQYLAVFASTTDILQETAEELRQAPVTIPVII